MGRTTVTLRATPHGASDEEIAAFGGMHASMAQGYGTTFDALDAVLGKA